MAYFLRGTTPEKLKLRAQTNWAEVCARLMRGRRNCQQVKRSTIKTPILAGHLSYAFS